MKENKKIAVIILAGGSGVRIKGLKAPKQFALIDGKPMLIHCLETYTKIKEVDEICLAVNERFYHEAKSLLRKYRFPKLKNIVAGGKVRQDSIRNAYERVKTADFVIIHNSVSPLVSGQLIRKCVKVAKAENVVVTGYIPAFHTVFEKQGNRLKKVLERSSLGYACDPQVFPNEILKKIFKRVGQGLSKDRPMLTSTMALGCPVQLVESDTENIKTTFAHDLDAIAAVFKKRKKI